MLTRPLLVTALALAASGCADTSPKTAAEKAVRAIYAEPGLGTREGERDVLRRFGNERMQTALTSSDASCAELIANTAPNHGLVGTAVGEFERTCVSGLPLSCGQTAAKLTGVTVNEGAGEAAVVVAAVDVDGAPKSVELSLRLVANKYLVDDVHCP